MTIAEKTTTKRKRQKHLPEVQNFLSSYTKAHPASSTSAQKELEADVIDAVQSRCARELADLKILRSIFKLSDLGVPQREIASLMGVSQPEISRRLRRRALTPVAVSPREIALRRAAGELSTTDMLEKLSKLLYTAAPPSRSASFDGAASSTGTAKELAASLQEGLLSRDEYETLRGSVRIARKARRA